MSTPARLPAQQADFSKVKEVVSAWKNIQQLLRSGDQGDLVPVVIPKDRRGFGWLYLLGVVLYLVGVVVFSGNTLVTIITVPPAILLALIAFVWVWRSSIVEIEQGTTGVLSRYGKIEETLPPGRRRLFKPWEKVEFIVDTSTEFPYTAPVVASPTRENVPLKSIEFFLKFRIVDPVKFVRNIGASNFDIVLSSAVQDAIRRRSRQVETERAYDLRGSDVGDMQHYLNRQMERYGVTITGANIPDVQLPDQYQQDLATRERVEKEMAAYEKEWDLTRKQRSDALMMEIERAKKERDARLIEVRAAINKAREDVAQMIQEMETDAQKVRLEIEAEGRAELKAAENEAKALKHLGTSYKENRAVLKYELAKRRLAVAERLMRSGPRPVLVNSEGEQQSALSTLLLAHLLPTIIDSDAVTVASDGDAGSERKRKKRSSDDLLGSLTQATKQAMDEE